MIVYTITSPPDFSQRDFRIKPTFNHSVRGGFGSGGVLLGSPRRQPRVPSTSEFRFNKSPHHQKNSNDETSEEAFKFRRGQYFWHARAIIGQAAARAVAQRVQVAEHTLRRHRVHPHTQDDLAPLSAKLRHGPGPHTMHKPASRCVLSLTC
jgi:hypothetical protein